MSSKYGRYVIETSLDGALSQEEESVRLSKPKLQTQNSPSLSPQLASPTMPSKTVLWFRSRTFYLAKIHW